MNTKEINMYTIEALNITEYINKLKADAKDNGGKTKFDSFPAKIGYALYKNFKTIAESVKDFNDFRDKLQNELQADYFANDEKAEDFQEEYEENGEKKSRMLRKIKDAFVPEFTAKTKEMDRQLEEILREPVTLTVRTFDVDEAIDSLPDDADFTDLDFSILELFNAEA